MRRFSHKGDTGGWSDIKLRASMARLGLHDTLLPGQLATLPSISAYRQKATLLTVPLTKLLVVSPLWYRHCSVYLNFSMSTLHKPSQRNSRKPETKQQQPTSHLLYSFPMFPETITKKRRSKCAYTVVCMYNYVRICMASTRNKFVVTPPLVQ